MSSRRGSSNSSFHSADGTSSRRRSTEHREKFRSVDNLLLSHHNSSRSTSRHSKRASSGQSEYTPYDPRRVRLIPSDIIEENNCPDRELAADAGRACYQRNSNRVMTPEPTQGSSRHHNFKQAHSTVDLQDLSGRRSFRQVHSTVDLQDTTTRRNTRQAPRVDEECISKWRNSKQKPIVDRVEDTIGRCNNDNTRLVEIESISRRRSSRQALSTNGLDGTSGRRHSRQALSLDDVEDTSSRYRSRQAHSTIDLQGTSSRRHFRQAQSTADLQGTVDRRISRQALNSNDVEGINGRRTHGQTSTIDNVQNKSRRRNSIQALDTADAESNSSRRSSRQALSLDGVECTGKRRKSKQAFDGVDAESVGIRRSSKQHSLDGFEGTGRRSNSRNALDTADVESNCSRRSSRQALSVKSAEGGGRRRSSRDVRDIVDAGGNISRRSSRQALSLNGIEGNGGRRSSRQALDRVDARSTGSRRSSKQAPTSKYVEENRYRHNPNEAPDFTDVEDIPLESYSDQEAALVDARGRNFNEGYSTKKNNSRRPDTSQAYSSDDPEAIPPRRETCQEFSSEDAGDHVLSSDDPEVPRSVTEDNAPRRNIKQVYSSDDAPSPRGQEPESDEAGRSSNQASDDVEAPVSTRVVYEAEGASRRTSCVAFSSDDVDGDISRRTSCMGLASGDTGGANSDRSSIQALSSNEADVATDFQDDDEFHDAEDGRSHHSSNRALALPRAEQVLSENQSDGDAGDGLNRTRPNQNVEHTPTNPALNRQRSFAQDEGDITEDMLSVYLSGGHTRARCASKKARSFNGEHSPPHRPAPKFRSQGDLRPVRRRSNQALPLQEENDDDDDDEDDMDDVRSSHRSSIGLPVVDEEDEGSQSSANEGSHLSKGGASLDRSSRKALSSIRGSNKRCSDAHSSSSSFDDENDARSSKRRLSRKAREAPSNKSSKMSFHSAKEKLPTPNTRRTSHSPKAAPSKHPRATPSRSVESTPFRSGASNKPYIEPKVPKKVSPSGTKVATPKIAANLKGAVPKAVPSTKGAVPKLFSNNTPFRGGKGARRASNMSFHSAVDAPCISDAEAELAFYSTMDVTTPMRPSRPQINAAGVCFKCTMICKKENMIEGEFDRFYCRSCYEKLNGSPRSMKTYPFSVHYSSTTLCTESTVTTSSGLKVEACNDMAAACTKCVTLMNVKDMEKIENKYYCHPCLDKINSPGGMEEENKLVNETDLEKFVQMFENPEQYVCLQPPSMEDRELISSKPLKCPKITCRKHVSTTHVESHFRVEHREIPILTTRLGRLNTMEMLPNEINYGCKVIMLLNVDDYDFPLTTPLTATTCADLRPNELDRPNPKPVMLLLCARIPSDELKAYSSDLLSEHSFRPYGGSEEVPDVMPEDEKIIFWVASNMFTDLSYAVCISTRDTERRQKFCGEIRELEEVPIELSAKGYSLTLLHYHANKMSRKGKKPLNVSVVIHSPSEKKA